ncbi:LuxR C-terminal-related transcriptional regulator [Luteimonas sp. RD2P54]|uniref:LuxR C-terminal-related transcriptional regulator n=1 Tax=Luteimonas endophytica TaxID=3042023 RepID=A0ABT6JBV3_9GAMM|nr:LuxR C-terminal-related transcriptional regulator [Luteimonas endophytica]MDH5824304.1 LuxR C-terminal-related transcriptional regulator [Luteimonas endophytica]
MRSPSSPHADASAGPGPVAPRATAPLRGPRGARSPALTPRERQIVRMLAIRPRCRQIAAALGISADTVRKHRANIVAKLGVGSTAQLIALAVGTHAAVPVPTRPGMRPLSARQAEVARELRRGQTSKEIARRLGLSPRTIDKHRQNAMRRARLSGMAELMRLEACAGAARPRTLSGAARTAPVTGDEHRGDE